METQDYDPIDFGFEARIGKKWSPVYVDMSLTLTVTGMSCEHCEQSVVEALKAVDGVENATADEEAARATVEGEADIDALIEAVESAGYEASG